MGEGETPSHCLLFVFLYDYQDLHSRSYRPLVHPPLRCGAVAAFPRRVMAFWLVRVAATYRSVWQGAVRAWRKCPRSRSAGETG